MNLVPRTPRFRPGVPFSEETLAMPCPAEIHRSFPDRDAAIRYLASRGFLCAASGWTNGRWTGTVERASGRYEVAIRLRLSVAA